jgi:ketosteroid isomerase-like protein
MPAIQDELMERERQFWNALDNPDFYRKNMAQDALAVINGEVKTRDDVVAMTREMPVKWDNIRFQNPRFVQISEDTAAVTYDGRADQKTGERYTATITSVYTRRDGKYVLVLTTHTPTADAATGNGTRTRKEAAAAHAR